MSSVVLSSGIISVRSKFSSDAVFRHHLGILVVQVSLTLVVVGAGLGPGPLDGVGVLCPGCIVGVELFGVICSLWKLFITSTDSLESLRKVRSSVGDLIHEPIS